MIHTDFDWSDLLNKLILAAAIAILPLQLWLLLRGRVAGGIVFSGRLILRLVLNILLWVSILCFVLQPYIFVSASSKIRILAGKEVPSGIIDKIRDSLQSEVITVADLHKNSADTLLLIGQNFNASLFGNLRQLSNQPSIQWLPYSPENGLQSLHWSGVVRKGEIQTVYGTLKSAENQTLKIQFGGQTLDSAVLHAGINDFRFGFPAFSQGRSSVELVLGKKTIDTLRFFARPAEPMTVRFLLDSPDFETRNLATWLGKNGNSAHYDVKLSKDLLSNQNINAAKEPDLLITDPENAADASVRKALDRGKSVLFINLSNPPGEIQAINAALKTKFQVHKMSNDAAVKISPELNALPYRFAKTNYHLGLPQYPVTIEKKKGTVGVSLLSETFPMQLTGDSMAYEKVWNAILALVRPNSADHLEIGAPVYLGLNAAIVTNKSGDQKKDLRIGNDTIFTQKSILNPKSASAEFLPTEGGWVTLQDSTAAEIYVEKSGPLFQVGQMADFMRSYSQAAIPGITKGDLGNHIHRKLPEWFWFAWLLICFTALWVEAKF